MIRTALATSLLLCLAACGRSREDKLQDAANQSGPAAASVLENAADNGMAPQDALAVAGEAQVMNGTGNATVGLPEQARPNTAENPNPPASGQPVETTTDNKVH